VRLMQWRYAATVALAITTAWPIGATSARPFAQEPDRSATAAQKFNTAKEYFERARKLGFPAAAAKAPYVLKAEFTTRGSSGEVQTGTYTDTWVTDKRWRREAVFGKSRFVRSRNGKRFYRLDEGSDAELLQFVLTVMEPLPEARLVHNSDWKIKRDEVDGVATVRVATGREDSDGTPDPKSFEAYWFDDSGQLVKTYSNSMQTKRSEFEDFHGISVARRVEVLRSGKVGMRIDVTELGPAGTIDPQIFTIKGHDWKRDYATEVR
jgi:hypothetical protein